MSRRSDRRDRRAIDKAARERGRSEPIVLDGGITIDGAATPAPAPAAAARPTSGATSAARPPRDATSPGSGRQLRAWRWPALLAVPVLLIAGTIVENRVVTDDESTTVEAPATPLMPTVSATDALSSTWFCAAGTATGVSEGTDDDASADDTDDTDTAGDDATAADTTVGAAEQTVHVANQSDVDRTGTVTVFPEGADPVESPLTVAAYSTTAVRVSDIVTAPHAAALVEMDGGGVTVQHELVGPAGRSINGCASAPSPTWTFPVGTTRPGSSLSLTLFNPFPGEAVVDVSALSEDGAREPEAYQGLVVPGAGVVTLELSEIITLRAEVTTLVKARQGRIVAEIIQTADGTIVADEGEPDDNYLPTMAAGLTATLGAPSPSNAWIFPNGATAADYSERYVVYNPSDTVAEVDVQVLLDDPATNGIAEPFEITVEPHSYRSVELFPDPELIPEADTRVPPAIGHAVVVRSRNDVGIIAGRGVFSTSTEEVSSGLAYTIGAPVEATRWMAAIGAIEGQTGSSLTIFNPSTDTPVVVSVRATGNGRHDLAEGLDSVTIAPNSRKSVAFPADGLGVPGLGFEVTSDRPIVVESHFRLGGGADIAFVLLDPVAGTITKSAPTVGEISADALLTTD